MKLNLETKIKGSEGLPKINSDFNLLWNFDNAQTTSSSGSFGTIDHIGFDNVQLDMGSFFEFLKPVIQKIKTIIVICTIFIILQIIKPIFPIFKPFF